MGITQAPGAPVPADVVPRSARLVREVAVIRIGSPRPGRRGISELPPRVARVTKRTYAVLAVTCLAVATLVSACGSSDSAAPASRSPASSTTSPTPTTRTPTATATATADSDPTGAAKKAVTAYSDAFLDARPVTAYNLLSKRCHAKVSFSYFTGIITAARTIYGKALPIRSFKAKVARGRAVVSYTYDVPALNQKNEPWVLEREGWKNDQC
jgi:hypothetical protein